MDWVRRKFYKRRWKRSEPFHNRYKNALRCITPLNSHIFKGDFDLDKSIVSVLEEDGADRYTSIFASPVPLSRKIPEVLKITSARDLATTEVHQLGIQSPISPISSLGTRESQYAYIPRSEKAEICMQQINEDFLTDCGEHLLKMCRKRVEPEQNLSDNESPSKVPPGISIMKPSTGKKIGNVLKKSPGKALSKLLKKSQRNAQLIEKERVRVRVNTPLIDKQTSTTSTCTDGSSLSTHPKLGLALIPPNYTYTTDSEIDSYEPCSYHKCDTLSPTQNQCNVSKKDFQLNTIDNTLDVMETACEEGIFQRIENTNSSARFARVMGKIIPMNNKSSEKTVRFTYPSLMAFSSASKESS